MKTFIFTAAAALVLLASCVNTVDADVVALSQSDSLVTFANGGSITQEGTTAGAVGTSANLFDGDVFATTADTGFFATNIFGRSRSNEGQTVNIAGVFVDFDPSAFQSVTSATLDFTAYSLNNNGPITIGQVTQTGIRMYDPDRVNVGNANFTEDVVQPVENFSFDITDTVAEWVADPTSNLGLYFQIDNASGNDGFGIFDGTATQINDGSMDDAFTGAPIPASYVPLTLTIDGVAVPEPSSALLLVLGGIVFGVKRRRN